MCCDEKLPIIVSPWQQTKQRLTGDANELLTLRKQKQSRPRRKYSPAQKHHRPPIKHVAALLPLDCSGSVCVCVWLKPLPPSLLCMSHPSNWETRIVTPLSVSAKMIRSGELRARRPTFIWPSVCPSTSSTCAFSFREIDLLVHVPNKHQYLPLVDQFTPEHHCSSFSRMRLFSRDVTDSWAVVFFLSPGESAHADGGVDKEEGDASLASCLVV